MDENDESIFEMNNVFPDADALFSYTVEPVENIKDDCLIVLDTNVLLFPYKTGKTTLDQISKIYKKLIDQQRLIIPGRVAREFAKNRGGKISELFQQIARKSNSAGSLKNENYPLLDSLKEYKEMISLEEEINKSLGKYRSSLSNLLDKITLWQWNDPVTKMYKDLFSKGVVLDIDFDKNEIRKDLIRRNNQRIPPGYKDASKPDSGIGDLIIWHTILNLAQNKKKCLILVSGDEKADWQIRSEGQALCPRYELIDEFRRYSGGASFHILSFSKFLDLFGGSESVVAEIREKEMLINEFQRNPSRNISRLEYNLLYKWLVLNYPEQLVRRTNDSNLGIDFEIIYPDDSKIGIDVMTPRSINLSALKRRVHRGYSFVEKGLYKNIIVAIIANNSVESNRLGSISHSLFMDSKPNVAVLIGYFLENRFIVSNFE